MYQMQKRRDERYGLHERLIKKNVMKKRLKYTLLIMVSLIVLSCSPSNRFDTITIDGCEYIERDSFFSYKYGVTHKGNCSNSFHKLSR